MIFGAEDVRDTPSSRPTAIIPALKCQRTDVNSVAPLGYGAILFGTALIFVSFLNYAKIATVAEELKNPGRNLPLAVIGSVALVTVIYAILVSIMLGVAP